MNIYRWWRWRWWWRR